MFRGAAGEECAQERAGAAADGAVIRPRETARTYKTSAKCQQEGGANNEPASFPTAGIVVTTRIVPATKFGEHVLSILKCSGLTALAMQDGGGGCHTFHIFCPELMLIKTRNIF